MRTAALLPALLLSFFAAAGAAENLLQNPGFEEGPEGSFDHWSPVWPRNLPEPPRFDRVAREPRAGASAAGIRVGSPGGYSSLTQVIESPPPGARVARLEGWVRAE